MLFKNQVPAVSVVIPTYNRARCVREAIESVLTQTTNDYELIVVDDGSTDNTLQVLNEYGKRIRVIHQANAGVSTARNKGILAAEGKWIAFLDSDDLWNAEKLHRQLKDVATYPEVVAHMVDATITGHGRDTTLFELRGVQSEFERRPVRQRPLVDVLCVQFFTPTLMIRKEAIMKAGLFREEFTIYEDFEFLSRIALEGPFFVRAWSGITVRRVPSTSGALSDQHLTKKARSLENLCTIYAGLLARDLQAGERRSVKRRLSGARYELSRCVSRTGAMRAAMRLRLKSVKDDFGPRALLRAMLGPLGADHMLARFRAKRQASYRRSELDLQKSAT